MYQIDQEIANRIAESYPMRSNLMWDLFQASEEEADKWEALIRQNVEKEMNSKEAARGFLVVGALYLERQAIGMFRRAHPTMAQALPEILTVEEAILIAAREIMPMEDDSMEKLRRLLIIMEKPLKNGQRD